MIFSFATKSFLVFKLSSTRRSSTALLLLLPILILLDNRHSLANCFSYCPFIVARNHNNNKAFHQRYTNKNKGEQIIFWKTNKNHQHYPNVVGFTNNPLFISLRMSESSSSSNENDEEVTNNSNYTSCKIGLITESSFPGAGVPRPELSPEEIPPLLMKALELNDFPDVDSGLTSVWEFAGETTRHIFQQNITEFIESAHDTASTMATSFYGVAMNGKSWSMETDINRVGGEEGWIATQIMKTISSDGRLRRWQWELRKHKRPPNLNCWYVESIGSSNRKGQFEAEE